MARNPGRPEDYSRSPRRCQATPPGAAQAAQITEDNDPAIAVDRGGQLGYSYRSESTGSSRDARMAGYRPKNTPTTVENRSPVTTDQAET